MVTVPGFSSPNRPDRERAYRCGSGLNSRSDAHCAYTVGNGQQPSGDSRMMYLADALGFDALSVAHRRRSRISGCRTLDIVSIFSRRKNGGGTSFVGSCSDDDIGVAKPLEREVHAVHLDG